MKGYSKKKSPDGDLDGDDDYVQEYDYSYSYKSIIYDKSESDTPSNTYWVNRVC